MLLQLQTFIAFIKKHSLFDDSATILLAVSGGKDSVVMAHLFYKSGFKIAISHCNFNLRGEESLRDEEFVRNLAKDLNVPLHVTHFDTKAYADAHKISTQMAARDLRYNFFKEVCEKYGYQKLATAHHANDGMETLLLNLIRGTGIAGLHGIKQERDFIIRPMLCFTRKDIDEIVEQNNLDFVEDSSNSSDKYVRNKIRLKIIPEMKTINPFLEDTFNQNINYFSKLEDFVKEQIEHYKSNLLENHLDGIKISISKLKEIKNLEFVLSELLMPYGFNLTSIKDLINCIGKESGRIFYSKEYEINVDRDYIFLSRLKATFSEVIEVSLSDARLTFGNKILIKQEADFKNESISKDKNICCIDSNKLIYPLKIRIWQQGDKFVPIGMKGQKKLSDFFINQKTPVSAKKEIFVLENGDGNIIWIIGLRMDDRFKIIAETKKLTTFEYKVS